MDLKSSTGHDGHSNQCCVHSREYFICMYVKTISKAYKFDSRLFRLLDEFTESRNNLKMVFAVNEDHHDFQKM